MLAIYSKLLTLKNKITTELGMYILYSNDLHDKWNKK